MDREQLIKMAKGDMQSQSYAKLRKESTGNYETNEYDRIQGSFFDDIFCVFYIWLIALFASVLLYIYLPTVFKVFIIPFGAVGVVAYFILWH